jgi:hypothetical protein
MEVNMTLTIETFKHPSTETYCHRVSGVLIQRFNAAIVWPGQNPGCCCVVGEEFQKEISRKQRKPKFYYIDSVQASDHREMIRKCVDILARIPIETFYSTQEKAAIYTLQDWNSEQGDNNLQEIWTQVPSCYQEDGNIEYHLSVLKELMNPTAERLLWLDMGQIRSELANIPANVINILHSEFPQAAALAYVTTSLEADPYCPNDEVSLAKTDYDLFGK